MTFLACGGSGDEEVSDDEIARLERYFDMRIEKVEERVNQLHGEIRTISIIAKIMGTVFVGSAGMGIVMGIQYLATH